MIPSADPNRAKELQQIADIAKQLAKLNGEIEAQEGEDDISPEDLPLRKRMFYAAMVRTFGNVTQCCNLVGIKRGTYRQWLKNDELFSKLINEGDFEDRAIDYVEGKLFQNIDGGNVIAQMYYLNNKGKKRGYNVTSTSPANDPNKKPSWFDTSKIEDAEIVPEPKQISNNAGNSSGNMAV